MGDQRIETMLGEIDLPKLQDIKIEGYAQDNEAYYLKAIYEGDKPGCAKCGSDTTVKFGNMSKLLLDKPVHGKRVEIDLKRHRYRCRNCGKTCVPGMLEIHHAHPMTKRLTQYIARQSLTRTFTDIAKEIGIDEKTVRNIFREYVKAIEKSVRLEAPAYLGIEKINISRKSRCVITNVRKKTISLILENRCGNTVAAALKRIHNRQRVESVSIDMWQPYYDAVRAELPRAKVVIDKDKLIHVADETVDALRKKIGRCLPAVDRRELDRHKKLFRNRNADLTATQRNQVQRLLDIYPRLDRVYKAKEAFRNVWDVSNRIEAAARLKEWSGTINDQLPIEYATLLQAIKKWNDIILNCFDYPTTTGYAEAITNLNREANRYVKEYSFEVARAKMLYAHILYQDPQELTEKATTIVLPKSTRDGIDIESLADFLSRESFRKASSRSAF